jgi:hypothetical protein
MTTEEFFDEFRAERRAGAEANSSFELTEFMLQVAEELEGGGFLEGFEPCHYRAPRGMRIDGYWFNDDGVLHLFIADFESRVTPEVLGSAEVAPFFRRLENFLVAALEKGLADSLEQTSPEYGLARLLADRRSDISKVNFCLVSERQLSERMQNIPDAIVAGIPGTYSVWDITRLMRQRSSRGQKEPLEIDFEREFGGGIPCLPAHLESATYQSYLAVIPGQLLAELYDRYGTRLLEQNVRTFLSARGGVNKGIRTTILNEPGMFFAFNNGVAATARDVVITETMQGPVISRLVDLQIVNGGQTTASLYHARKRDKVTLEGIFVQMKLSIIEPDRSEEVVPRISLYANTQNKVNAADFFSNHPFHIRMEEFSRRLWAPPSPGEQREVRWFYERTRGQYEDALSRLSGAAQKRFRAEFPKEYLFNKEDLAKYENVWDEHPTCVQLGAQKNFVKYAGRIGREWESNPDLFSEHRLKRSIARAIMFRTLEKLVPKQQWFLGSYRANVIAFTLSMLGAIAKRRDRSPNYALIWNRQSVPEGLLDTLLRIAEVVHDSITDPSREIENVTEWCKKEACWTRLEQRVPELERELAPVLSAELIGAGSVRAEAADAARTQRTDDGIAAQKAVIGIPAVEWQALQRFVGARRQFSPDEHMALRMAVSMPKKVPDQRQSRVLLQLMEAAREDGFLPP